MKPAKTIKRLWFIIALFGLCSCEQNDSTGSNTNTNKVNAIHVTDFSGQKISLSKPASRIVALAPHIVENVYSAGAGENLVGAVAYSNYPDQAQSLPLVGGYASTNLEKIVELNPDLIIAWQSGNKTKNIDQMKQLGFTVYVDQPHSLEDVAKSLRDIGTLSGHSQAAEAAAVQYLKQLQDIRQQNKHKSSVSVFYQVWNDPLQTINGQHIISNAMSLCGGQNVYADEATIAPVINIESILQRDPLAIIASGMSDARPEWLDDWKKWPSLTAVQKGNLFFVDPDHIQRHTIRILLGVKSICEQFDLARQRER